MWYRNAEIYEGINRKNVKKDPWEDDIVEDFKADYSLKMVDALPTQLVEDNNENIEFSDLEASKLDEIFLPVEGEV